MNKSIFSKFMGKEELEERDMKEKLNILRAFTEHELDDYTTLTGRSKHEICSIVNCEIKDINELIVQYETFVSMHTWVHRTRDKGEPIPKNQEELFERFKANPVFNDSILKKRNRKMKFSKKQKDAYMKYGHTSISY